MKKTMNIICPRLKSGIQLQLTAWTLGFSLGVLGLLTICPSLYARGKNLYHLVEGRTLRVYLTDFQSDTEKISPDILKNILKETLLERKKENFDISEDEKSAEIIIECRILAFKYLNEDPVDQFFGATAIIADAVVIQNYAQAEVEFQVLRVKDNRRLWRDKFVASVTQTDMPEPDSIPKVLKECSKRFIYLCFGKPKK